MGERGKLLCLGKCILDFDIIGVALYAENCTDEIVNYSGKIIIVDNPNPSIVLMMREVSGVICLQGGITSHVAVLGREMGVPVIVGVGNVREKIRNESLIRMCGRANEGRIYEQ